MAGDSTEGINFKVITTGRAVVDARKPCNFDTLTLKKLIAWIEVQTISDGLKEELKKMASTYPQNALGKWFKNYQKHLTKAQMSIANKDVFVVKPKVELGDEPPQPRKTKDKR